MDYFVTIESNSYFSWQIELLIASFKKQRLLDNLVVGIVNPINILPDNLKKHKRKFQFKGANKKYKKINKLLGITSALENKIIKFPFTVIHADMLLVDKKNITSEEIVYQENTGMSGVCCFNNSENDFFYDAFKKINDGYSEEESWLLSFHYSRKLVVPEMTLECPLNTLRMGKFIHYTNGWPPYFIKNQFKNNIFPDVSPFRALKNLPQLEAVEYIKTLADFI